MYINSVVKSYSHRSVVPNRGAAEPWGAIYSAQGCRGLTRFFTISLKIHFQTVIKPQSKLLWVRHYGCRKLLFFSVGCRKPKKVGKHWHRFYPQRVHSAYICVKSTSGYKTCWLICARHLCRDLSLEYTCKIRIIAKLWKWNPVGWFLESFQQT